GDIPSPFRCRLASGPRRTFLQDHPTSLRRLQRNASGERRRRQPVLSYDSDCLCSCLYPLISWSFVFSSFKRLHTAFLGNYFHVPFHQFPGRSPRSVLFELFTDLFYFFDEKGVIESLDRS